MSQHLGNCFLGAQKRTKRLAMKISQKFFGGYVKERTSLGASARVANQQIYRAQFVPHAKEGFLDLCLVRNVSRPEDASFRSYTQSYANLFQRIRIARQRRHAIAFARKDFYETRADARTNSGYDRYLIFRHTLSSFGFSRAPHQALHKMSCERMDNYLFHADLHSVYIFEDEDGAPMQQGSLGLAGSALAPGQ